MSSPCKLDANFSTTFSATIIHFPPRTLTGAIAVPRLRPTPRACLAPVWLVHRSTLRGTQIEKGVRFNHSSYPDCAPPGMVARTRRARVTGIGGIFFKAKDPEALVGWCRRDLGIAIEATVDHLT